MTPRLHSAEAPIFDLEDLEVCMTPAATFSHAMSASPRQTFLPAAPIWYTCPLPIGKQKDDRRPPLTGWTNVLAGGGQEGEPAQFTLSQVANVLADKNLPKHTQHKGAMFVTVKSAQGTHLHAVQ